MRGGYTLVELLMTLSTLAIIMLAAQSAVLVASKSIPDGRSGSSAVLLGSRAMDMLSADLTYANTIVNNSATDLSFKVAARDANGPPTIRYYLSGTKLMRQYNGGTAVSILDNVQEFQLLYDKRTVTLAQTYTEGSEVTLASSDSASSQSDFTIDSTHSAGEYFVPTLPANATSWRLTRVSLMATRSALSGATSIQIRNAASSLPTSTVLAQQTMSGGILGLVPAWQTFTYSGLPQTAPGVGMTIVALYSSATPSALMRQATVTLTTASMFSSSDNGATWTTTAAKNLQFYAYGTVTVPDPVAYQYYLTGVRATVRAGNDLAGRVSAGIRILNEPTVSGP